MDSGFRRNDEQNHSLLDGVVEKVLLTTPPYPPDKGGWGSNATGE